MASGHRSPSTRSFQARRGSASAGESTYWTRALRPLHILVFLLPLLIAYELGSIVYLTDRSAGVQLEVQAHRLFGDFFHAFGLVGVFLPGVALVTVLLTWHTMLKEAFRIEPSTIVGMLLESLGWTLPLLVLSAVFSGATHTLAAAGTDNAVAGGFAEFPLMARLTISLGAGLYEEMLFRLVGIALLHFILVDLIQLSSRAGAAAAVLLAAIAFAMYHRPSLPDQWQNFLFYTVSGLYLGSVYTMRGFGIAAGTHALYDAMVLVVFPSLAANTQSS